MTNAQTSPVAGALTWGGRRARWVLVATVLGSAMTFIDATVVNISLPTVGKDLGADTTGLTWVVNAYTLSLAALVLLGGSLGDLLGRRRIFVVGVLSFAGASVLCGLAPNVEILVVARAAQGVGGALLTPSSLAILQASFGEHDRARAIGAWAGLTGTAGALGPLLGGWLVQVGTWRLVFLINVPVALLVLVAAYRHVPESTDQEASRRLDVPGALLLVAGLGSITYALTASSTSGFATANVSGLLALGVALMGLFVVWELRAEAPLLPLDIFRSRLFVVMNTITLVAYTALGAVFFGLVVTLQVGVGVSPLAAGLALLPVTILMLLFSSRVGGLMVRVGARPPMIIGPLVAAAGVGLLSRLDADSHYVLDVLVPTTLFGAGLTIFVTPLTATVLSSVPEHRVGLASGVNNAVARTAGLLAVAALPLVAGLGAAGLMDPAAVLEGFGLVAWLCTGLLVCSSVMAALLVPGKTTQMTAPPSFHVHAHGWTATPSTARDDNCS